MPYVNCSKSYHRAIDEIAVCADGDVLVPAVPLPVIWDSLLEVIRFLDNASFKSIRWTCKEFLRCLHNPPMNYYQTLGEAAFYANSEMFDMLEALSGHPQYTLYGVDPIGKIMTQSAVEIMVHNASIDTLHKYTDRLAIRAIMLAADFGRADVVSMMLDNAEFTHDNAPARYNPRQYSIWKLIIYGGYIPVADALLAQTTDDASNIGHSANRFKVSIDFVSQEHRVEKGYQITDNDANNLLILGQYEMVKWIIKRGLIVDLRVFADVAPLDVLTVVYSCSGDQTYQKLMIIIMIQRDRADFVEWLLGQSGSEIKWITTRSLERYFAPNVKKLVDAYVW